MPMAMIEDGEVSWSKSRKFALDRDGHACQKCGHQTKTELDVHHRVPRSMYVDNSIGNLITLCDACHAGMHLNLQASLSLPIIRRWAVTLSRRFDRNGEIPQASVDINAALATLGKSMLRQGQLEIILAALRGESVLAVRPTGSGKSLCFQLPALLTPGMTLVIEPLKALMKDQVKSLHNSQIPATFINGDLNPAEKKQRYVNVERGTWKFLFLAPERFDASLVIDPNEQVVLDAMRPALLVIDEAHSISQYGDNFRPSFNQLGAIRKRLGNPQVLAFTATAGETTQAEILDSLGIHDARVFIESPDRPNISLVRIDVSKKKGKGNNREDLIASFLRQVETGRAIIFVPTVKTGEELRFQLSSRGLDLEFFHSKSGNANWRDMIQGRFDGRIEPPIRFLIATSAFGMGLDIPDIRLVIHLQHPFSVEEYMQGFGRAGRDGRRSLAVLFFNGTRDKDLLDFMLDRQEEPKNSKRRNDLETISKITTPELARQRSRRKSARVEGDETPRCFRQGLLEEFGILRPEPRSAALRILIWALEAKTRQNKSRICCHGCNRRVAKKVSKGQIDWLF
jgi:RecQ family ATP-dependent DNA helicase